MVKKGSAKKALSSRLWRPLAGEDSFLAQLAAVVISSKAFFQEVFEK